MITITVGASQEVPWVGQDPNAKLIHRWTVHYVFKERLCPYSTSMAHSIPAVPHPGERLLDVARGSVGWMRTGDAPGGRYWRSRKPVARA